MCSPWPTCIHADDPTTCPWCQAELDADLRRWRTRAHLWLRFAWLSFRCRFRGQRGPF